MRIFEVTDCYPPPLAGGRDLRVQLLSRELARRGHEVDVLTLAGPKGSRTERDGEVRVHRLAGWSRILSPLYADPEKPFHPTLPDPGLVGAISRLLKRAAAAHRPCALMASVLAAAAAAVAGDPAGRMGARL